MRRWILIGLAACCAAAAGTPAAAVTRPAKGVTVSRDSHGEAYVRGDSARMAIFGLAYAQMSDQAAYVLANLATATGRSAELLGPDCLPGCFRQDQITHAFRVPESAAEGYGTLPPESRGRLAAFASGINAFVADHPARVPSWAQPVTAEAVLASVEYPFVLAEVSEAAGAGGAGAAIDAGDPSAASVLRAAPDRFSLGASNGFALDGSRTASGKPILEGNPHLPFTGASQWYGARLVYPGTRVAGVTFRGIPGIAIGTNGDVAWTHTANAVAQNESDTYVETLRPGEPDQYLYGGGYEPMTVREVPIDLRTASGMTTVTATVRYTVHGPVISDPLATVNGNQPAPATGTALAATVSQYGQVGLATQLWAENEARSLKQFKRALAGDQLSGFNILAADDAHVFYSSGSRSGILNPGLTGDGVMDGSDPYNSWQGIVPFERLPQATDPPSGYYQNANNAPAYSAPGQIDSQALPLYLQGGGNGTRSRRQIALLDPLADARLADAQRIGLDSYVEIAPGLEGLLDQAAAAPGADPRVAAAAALIDTWDERALATSTQYPLFATWVRGLREDVLGFQVSEPPPPGTQFSAAQRTEASRAMIVAADGMVQAYGALAVPYGSLHTFTWGPLTAAVNGGDADLPTLRMTNCKGEAGATASDYYHPCHVRGGSGFAFNVDLANGRLTVMRPVSDTDDPSSRYYTRNASDYVADRYRVWPLYDSKLRPRVRRLEVAGRGPVALPVRCRPNGNRRCRGTLKLLARPRAGSKGAAEVAARAKFSLPAGGHRLRLRLSVAARRAIEREGGLATTLESRLEQLSGEKLEHEGPRVRLVNTSPR